MKAVLPMLAMLLSMSVGNATASPQDAGHAHDHAAMQQQVMAPSAAKPDPEFVALDKNKDGKIGKGELPAKHPLAPHFGMLDSNRDGSLSPAEFAKRHAM